MKYGKLKRLGMPVFAGIGIMLLTSLSVQSRSLLDEMLVPDTCGNTYTASLATCTPFSCTKPSPMAAMYGAIPKDAQAKLEKNIESLSSKQREEMKAKMTSTFEIKGLDAQGRCQIITMAVPGQRMECNLDKSVLQQVSEYSRLMAQATDIESESTSHVVNGKMVTESTMTIDGVKMADLWTTALNNGQCNMMIADADVEWISMSQMNGMSHFEFNLLEHGKHVDGHIQILNNADGQILFDKDVKTSYDARKINLNPGTFDIKVVSKNSELATVWFRSVKLGVANTFRKDIEFYAISGTLKLTLNVDGQATNMAVYITDPVTHEWLYPKASVFGKEPKFYFKSSDITLPESLTGKYEIFVTPVKRGFKPTKNAKYEKFLLTIHNGDIVEKMINIGQSTIAEVPVKKNVKNTAPQATPKKQFPVADANGMEQNTDRPEGGLIRNFSPVSANPALCQKACKDDARCKAWTYVKPNTIQGPSPNCWLKDNGGRAYPNECCISGLVE